MADVVFGGVIVVFFGLAVALLRACARIIGPDADPSPERGSDGGVEAGRPAA